MTGDEFKKIVKGLKAVYADPKFLADQDAINVWFQLLKDLPYEVASMATQAYMQSEKFPPTPADIRRYATQITSPITDDMSEIEAWHLVSKALQNGYYGAEAEFAKLPPLIQQVLGNPARLREMAQLEQSEVETVEQSHFIRNYRAKLESSRRNRQLMPTLQVQIEQMRQNNTPVLEVHEVERKGIEIKEEPAGIPDDIEELLKQFHEHPTMPQNGLLG